MILPNSPVKTWEIFAEDGRTVHFLGQYNKAELLYKMALSGAQDLLHGESTAAAGLLILLGDLKSEQGLFARSEAYYRQSLVIYEEGHFALSIDAAIALKRMSEVCRAQSKDEQAEEYQRRSQEIVSHFRESLDKSWQRHRDIGAKINAWFNAIVLAIKLETLVGVLIPIGSLIATMVALLSIAPAHPHLNPRLAPRSPALEYNVGESPQSASNANGFAKALEPEIFRAQLWLSPRTLTTPSNPASS